MERPTKLVKRGVAGRKAVWVTDVGRFSTEQLCEIFNCSQSMVSKAHKSHGARMFKRLDEVGKPRPNKNGSEEFRELSREGRGREPGRFTFIDALNWADR